MEQHSQLKQDWRRGERRPNHEFYRILAELVNHIKSSDEKKLTVHYRDGNIFIDPFGLPTMEDVETNPVVTATTTGGGGGSDTDEKVKTDASDPTAGYLDEKLVNANGTVGTCYVTLDFANHQVKFELTWEELNHLLQADDSDYVDIRHLGARHDSTESKLFASLTDVMHFDHNSEQVIYHAQDSHSSYDPATWADYPQWVTPIDLTEALKLLPGYDETKVQKLVNRNGTIQWEV